MIFDFLLLVIHFSGTLNLIHFKCIAFRCSVKISKSVHRIIKVTSFLNTLASVSKKCTNFSGNRFYVHITEVRFLCFKMRSKDFLQLLVSEAFCKDVGSTREIIAYSDWKYVSSCQKSITDLRLFCKY